MQIDSIQLFRVPLHSAPSKTGEPTAVESVVVGVSSGGQIGWGEVSLNLAPCDSSEWSAGAFCCLRDWLAPALVGRTITSGDAVQDSLEKFQGNARAKSALDMAWWNLAAVRQSVPLYRLLGGKIGAAQISPCLSAMGSMDEFLAEIGSRFSASYPAVTLKFRPGWELEMVRAVRQAYPAEPIAIDCDGLCSLGQMEMFYRLEDFHLLHIEQPLAADDLVGHAMLQASLRTPICLDQSITSLERVEQAIDLASCRRVRIDISRVGGITPALAIQTACAAASVPCSLNVPCQALATCVSIALATLPSFSIPSEFFSCHQSSWVVVPQRNPFGSDGAGRPVFVLPETPGPGASVDPRAVAAAAVETAFIG